MNIQKKFIIVAVLFLPVVITAQLTNAVQPIVESELAMEQFVEPSTQVDTAQRIINYELLNQIVRVSWVLSSLLLFKKEIKECLSKIKS